MFYRAVAATCPGNDKEYNSNNIYLNAKYITDEIKSSEVLLKQKKEQEGLQFYGIAEGFGSDCYTDEASLIATKKLLAIQKKVSGNPINDNYDEAADAVYSYLEEYIQNANEAVIAKTEELSENNIYASIAVIGLYETAAITCNLGNTRIYLFRKGNLSSLSEDHNQAQVMYKNGVITEDKVARHPKRHKLTQYLGIMPEGKQLEPYYSEVEVKHGDIFVICSSAFCENVDDTAIHNMIKESRSLTQIAEKFMQAAAEKGFKEDTSVLVVRADEHAAENGMGTAVAAAGAAGAAAAAGSSAVSAKTGKAAEGGKPSAKAESKGEGGSADKPKRKFMDSVKHLLGLSPDAENEKVWPAVLTFGCCILVVIILTVLGIKIYRVTRPEGGKTQPPTANVGTPMPGSSASPSASATATSTSGYTPTPSPTGNQKTQEPTKVPTQEPTQAPTQRPTQEPTQEPTQAPTQAPTQEPTQEPTLPPTQEPTQEPTAPPTEAPTLPPEPSEEPTQEPGPSTDQPEA